MSTSSRNSAKVAYFDCISGISGDMTLGALVDAGVEFDALQDAIRSLEVANCKLELEIVKRHGFRASKIHVRHDHEHAHRHLHHMHEIIDRGNLTDSQRTLARDIFQKLAVAEAKVHGSTLEKVHFHEVGAVDSIADIVGSAVGLDLLGVDRFACSAVPTGTGSIEIAHGRVNVPAPATAELLKGIPIANSEIEFELTTPTGAAILATVVDEFGAIPSMTVEQIGYGAGDRELERQANVLRILVGVLSTANGSPHINGSLSSSSFSPETDQVWVVEANLDDCNPEWLAHCLECTMNAGALDVFSTAIQMKKGRQAVKMTAIVEDRYLAQTEEAILSESTTIGIRKWLTTRTKLQRRSFDVETPIGMVKGKVVVRPDGRESFAPEYESCREIAFANKIPLSAVYEAAANSFQNRAT